MRVPANYEERVYAGVLGKIIGVYLGRPFEGWWYDRLTERFGEVSYYVNEELNAPLVVTDDDISGTFTFLRALPDYGFADLTPAQIGQTWLNYLIQNRTILWWGGMGNSTEHTAYLRLKAGIPAPESGSIARNGRLVAEQIGAQIFIDGWGMISPGDPGQAADLARKAASVSHDGEAIYGAQVVAAMEASAFEERDLAKLLDIAVSLIPRDSVIFRMIADLREWRDAEPDWRKTREKLAERYGYHRYGGNCHVVPNHGVIVLGLLYGDDNFQKALAVTNTAGWDTDCNSGNVGCLMGIKNGLAGIEDGPDWRGPVADRMYLPTADGGRCITDALSEAYRVAGYGRTLAGESHPKPKGGARFHFSLPGSVQGFRIEDSPECRIGTVSNEFVRLQPGSEASIPDRMLKIAYHAVATGRSCRAGTSTFIPPEARKLGGYELLASPTLYPGQTIRARILTDVANETPVSVGLFLRFYGREDAAEIRRGPAQEMAPGSETTLEWVVEETGGSPIFETGIEIRSSRRAHGAVYLDYLSWEGTPEVTFCRPEGGGEMWRRAWVSGVTSLHGGDAAYPLRAMQDEGIGIASQGTREWKDYTVSAALVPRVLGRVGLAARVQGQRRYVAVVLAPGGRAQLIQALDGEQILARAQGEWELDQPVECRLEVRGRKVVALISVGAAEGLRLSGQCDGALQSGAVGIFCEAGRVDIGPVLVRGLSVD